MYIKTEINSEIEKRILTGMIVCTSYLRDVELMIKPKYFKVDYIRKISGWILDYYKKYKVAPNKDFESIFSVNSQKLKPAETEIMEIFLEGLSDQYAEESQESFPFNRDLLFDQTVDFCRDRSLEILCKMIDGHRLQGDFVKAEEVIKNYGKVAQQTSQWINPFDDQEVFNTFEEEEENKLFKLPGALGEMIGYLQRGWLISIMGPAKRGKCISGDSKILLSNGAIETIRNLVKNGIKKEIVSFNEKTQRFESIKISELFDNGIKDCYQVQTRTGRKISTTENHQYLTPFGWKYLKEIQKGDFIAVPKKIDFFGKQDMDESITKLLAYMIAEGGLTSTQPNFTNTDKEINLDFEKCCDKLNIGYKIKGDCHHLSKARPLMKKYGLLGGSSKNKLIPIEIMTASKKTISTFLRVFFTCDGSIFKDKNLLNIELSLTNEKLIDQISHLLLRFGIVHIKKNSPATLNGKKFPCWRISIKSQEFVDLFLREIGFDQPKYTIETFVKYKRSFLDCFPLEVARDFFNELKQETGCRPHQGKYPKNVLGFQKTIGKNHAKHISYMLNSNKNKTIMRDSFINAKGTKTYDKYINSEILWDTVKTITHIGQIDTYDISVPKNHNFIADDVLVHNSYYQWELAFHALTNKLKVCIFSFEMNKTTYKKRVYKRLTALADVGGEYAYPVFDCEYNQDNTCQKECRTNRGERPPTHTSKSKYKTCTACRGTKAFKMTNWWEIHNQKEDFSPKKVLKKTKAFKEMFGDNLRVRCYPAFSASFDEAIAELNNLQIQGFNPDVIIFDYFDIMASEVMNELEDENRKWKKGKGLSGELHALVINANQGNRESEEKKNIKQKHTGGNIKKLQHVDVELTLNQTPEEKIAGLMRIQALVNRHDESMTGEVVVLQNLKLGQPMLDSEWK